MFAGHPPKNLLPVRPVLAGRKIEMESYDFARAARPDVRHEAVLEPAGRGAGRAALVLSTILRRAATASVGSPASADALRVDNRRWYAFGTSGVRFGLANGDLAGLAEAFLGAPARRLERSLTPLEVTVLLPRLAEVLRPLAVEVGGSSHVDPALLEATTPDPEEPGVLIPVQIELDGAQFDMLVIAAPSAQHVAPVVDRTAVVDVIDAVPLEIVVGFPRVAIPSAELRSVVVGDVIRLDHSTDTLLSGTVGGQCIMRGRAGQNRRRLTLEVVEVELGGVA
jgi:flagellar motor switch/type III secretory pathway protein FliN